MARVLSIALFAVTMILPNECAWSKSLSTTVDAAVVQSRSQLDRGSRHVFAIDIPADISGKRLDAAILEFHIDVVLDESENPAMTPVVAAYPLEEHFTDGPAVFSSSFASARNVKPGSNQLVQLDITDIVRGWIADPLSNHGLIVGSFTGPKLDGLELRNNVVGLGKAAVVTFFYQNRFGDRISNRAR